MIKKNVFDILSKRNVDETVFLVNKYQKFQNVPAIRVRDEELFLNKLIAQCNKGDGEPFFLGSDSCGIAEQFYYTCKFEAPIDKQDKVLLFTAEEHILIYDANEQFKDKYIFYSPKITFGVDFNIPTSQNVYIYQKGDSIMPSGSYQQTTRTRNIKTLYYYSEVELQKPVYNDLNDVKETLTRNTNKFKSVYDLCTYSDENDELKIVENSFCNLFSYNEYNIDVYETNMTKHYEDILIENGFIITEEGSPIKMPKEDKTELKDIKDTINHESFDEFLNAENKKLDKFKPFVKRIELLQHPEDEEIYMNYEDQIIDKYELQKHFTIIKLLKNKQYIIDKLKYFKDNSFDVKTASSTYYKLLTIYNLEEKYKLKHLEVDYTLTGDIDMDESEYKNIKKLFRISKQQPKTYDELRFVYVNMIRHIVSYDIIDSKRSKSRKDNTRDKQVYSLKQDTLKYHLDLNEFMNPNHTKFNEDIVSMFNIKVKEDKVNNEVMFDDHNYDDLDM